MKLIVEPEIKLNKITTPQSSYNPGRKVRNRFKDILNDYQIADLNMSTSYEEFGTGSENNSLDLVTFINKMQKRFNNNIPSATNDPNQAWRSNTIRPLTRNKVISIVAHLTSSILYPTIIAQNDQNEEDKDMAMVMRDCVEWACEQSKYEDMFIRTCVDMCINPAIIIYQDYAEVKRKIKEITDKDKWEFKEIVDDVYSGFINRIVPCDELYVGNVYEPDIQKQPFLVWRRVVDYASIVSKYRDNDQLEYVQPGLRVFLGDNDTFYEQYDDQLQERLVEEVIYYNRDSDLELRLVNGVMMDDPDRPLQRKDKLYPFAKSYYEMFNSRFFYGMPLVAKIMPDQDVIDTLYNMAIDGNFLQIMPPQAVYGVEAVDSSVFIPGSVTAFQNPNSRIESINNGSNLTADLNMLAKVEASASESSQDPIQSGQQQGGDRTKYEVVRLENNARTVLGLTGKMVGSLVRDFGQLLVGCIVQHLPIAEVSEVVGDDVRLKFPSILIPNKNIDGKVKSRKIEFTTAMPESAEEQKSMELDLLQREGYNMQTGDDGDKSIAPVNPDAFRRMKYLIKVEPDFTDRATKFYKKMQLYDRAITNPMANQEAIYRDMLLGSFVPGEEDKYIIKKGEQNPIMDMVNKMPQGAMPIPKAEVPQPEQI